MLEHDIKFPNVHPAEDDIWTYGLVFHAKKFLRVPNVVYIWRQSEDSIMRARKTPPQTINFWLSPVVLGVKALDDLMSTHEFFQQNPQYRYVVLEFFVNIMYGMFLSDSMELQPFEVYEAIKQKFGDKLGEWEVLIPALCTALNTQQKISVMNQQQFNQFAAQAQQRISQLEEQLQNVRK